SQPDDPTGNYARAKGELQASSLSVLAKLTEEMTKLAVLNPLTWGTMRNTAVYGGRFEIRQCCSMQSALRRRQSRFTKNFR
ncbi:MAG: hypothetical protein ACP5PN_07515, partial [Steroidobacteraceae bacterium]